MERGASQAEKWILVEKTYARQDLYPEGPFLQLVGVDPGISMGIQCYH